MTLPRFTAPRSLATLALAGLCAALVAGCGDDVPSNSVAKVGDSNITKDEFNRWLKNAASGQQQGGGSAVIPDPPDYKKCVAGLKKQLAAQKGAPKQPDSALKKQCKTQYDQLKGEVMQFLIQSQWVQQEAEDRDVEVSDAEVKKSFNQQKKQAFPKEADYKKFLKDSGMNEEDILFRVKLDQLQTKLTQKVSKDKVKINNAGHRGVLRQEQEALRPAPAPRPERGAHQDQGQGRSGQGRPGRRQELQGRLEGVLDRPGLQGPGRQAAGRGQGQAGPGARQGRVRRQEGRGRGPGQDPVRLLRVRGHRREGRFPAVAGPGQGHHPQPAPQPARAEGAGLVRQGLPQEVQGADELLRGLPRRRVQERAEGQHRHRSGWRRAAGRSAGCRSAGCRPQGAAPQGAAPQGAAPQGAAPQGAAPQGAAPQGAAPQAPQGSGATPQTPSAPQPNSP